MIDQVVPFLFGTLFGVFLVGACALVVAWRDHRSEALQDFCRRIERTAGEIETKQPASQRQACPQCNDTGVQGYFFNDKAQIEAEPCNHEQPASAAVADAIFYWRYVGGSDMPESFSLPDTLQRGTPDSVSRQRAEHYGATIEVLRSIRWSPGELPESIPDASSLGRWLHLHLRGKFPDMNNSIPEYSWIVETLLAAAPAKPASERQGQVVGWADFWMARGMPDLSHDFEAFERAEEWRKAQPASAAVADHVRKLVGKLDQWRMCMSHSDSFVGEPAGLFKATIQELARATNPIYPEPRTENPFPGVMIYTEQHPHGVLASELIAAAPEVNHTQSGDDRA